MLFIIIAFHQSVKTLVYWFASLLSHYYHQISILSSIMWNRDMFSLYPSYYWLRKWRGRGGWGLFKSGACLILWHMVDNFFHFGDQAAGMLHIQMNYKYKRMIFFFLILEMVTFATSSPIKCVWNNPRGVNRFMINFNSIGKTVWMQRFMQRINKTDWFFLPDL